MFRDYACTVSAVLICSTYTIKNNYRQVNIFLYNLKVPNGEYLARSLRCVIFLIGIKAICPEQVISLALQEARRLAMSGGETFQPWNTDWDWRLHIVRRYPKKWHFCQ